MDPSVAPIADAPSRSVGMSSSIRDEKIRRAGAQKAERSCTELPQFTTALVNGSGDVGFELDTYRMIKLINHGEPVRS